MFVINKLHNDKITIFLTLRPLSPKISQQPENCENGNDPDLVQAFLKKWWVESDFKAPNLHLSLQLKVPRCHYNSIYNNNKAMTNQTSFLCGNRNWYHNTELRT
jgi:hypothetical protein